MPCYHPLTGYQALDGGALKFERPTDFITNTIQVACGQCIGCRLERATDWAIRCVHEKQFHKESCALTLTYDNKHLPPDLNLHYRHFQLFMKKLRRRNPHKKIKFYVAGEYGQLHSRPHWHAIIFGHDFDDKLYYKKSKIGTKLFKSRTANRLWNQGDVILGQVDHETAGYIARYICTKKTGKHAFSDKKNEAIIDPDTAELHIRRKEFNCMSRNNGIARQWLEKYHKDVINGTVIVRGKQRNAPRYYDNFIKKIDPKAYQKFKDERIKKAKAQKWDNTAKRLLTKEQVTLAAIKSITRELDQ